MEVMPKANVNRLLKALWSLEKVKSVRELAFAVGPCDYRDCLDWFVFLLCLLGQQFTQAQFTRLAREGR